MEHFTNRELKILKEFLRGNYPNNIPCGFIEQLHTHSNNAIKHFKSTGCMYYYTTLPGDSECAYIYSFGAPSHGKGVWDGLGGSWKRYINDLLALCKAKLERLEYVTGGQISSARNVWEALRHGYELRGADGAQRDRQISGTSGIKYYRFLYHGPGEDGVDPDPIQRPQNEAFLTLEGITQHYQFAVRGKGLIYQRMRPCWCLYCMRDMSKGTLEWGPESHNIAGCCTTASNSLFEFDKCNCTKILGLGVTRACQNDTKSRDEVSMSLNVGDWVLNDSNDEDKPIWLGRVIPNPQWNNDGILKNTTRRTMRFDNEVSISRNEIAMYIMWYEKIDINTDSLEYHVSRTITTPTVQSNEYMILQGFEMHQITGRNNPVPK